MKKLLGSVLAVLIVLGAMGSAFAAEAGEFSLVYENVRGNQSWTAESSPGIWITPFFHEHIMLGKEKYPPHFLYFAAPENASLMDFSYDTWTYLNHETLVMYSYYAYDSYAFELFFEDVSEEDIVLDGSDGVGLYINGEKNRGYALIDVKDHFGKTAKVQILLTDFSRALGKEKLQGLIEAELARVAEEMEFIELDHYWSENVFASVQLCANDDEAQLDVDTSGLTIMKADLQEIEVGAVGDRDINKVSVELDGYAYAVSKESTDIITLADGSEWVVYCTDYTGYASTLLLEEGKHGRPLYLTIEVDLVEEMSFEEQVQAMYDRIAIRKAEV